ncbi:26S proteasome non-ATPase regulatory subunit 2 homolog B-like [Vigna unguiculata]|uniref:26S proteasome non-ATPase regulatory subunit 2 homolog B-like n=1 Tax=Vigna unguiculata TaxID=3917 RepID=UPI001016894F|nr:26S proteasome non-ATPase regulatory subunit 2 homolog B-like [Vigna unguiculata]
MSPNRDGTSTSASVAKDDAVSKKKVENEDLSDEDLALKQQLDLYVERVQDADAGLQKVVAVEEEAEYSEAMATVLRRSWRRRERSRAKAMQSSLLLEMRLTPLSVTKESERERDRARESNKERNPMKRWREEEEEGFRNFKP